MINLPKCPKCTSEYTYEDNGIWICPDCTHEWSLKVDSDKAEDKKIVKDAHGNILNDGDSVALIKDLKIKGSSTTIKAGTKVKTGLPQTKHEYLQRFDLVC